ncbi:MAG: glycoside hydrolase family 88 protein [Leeuwenhoekiella sp.]
MKSNLIKISTLLACLSVMICCKNSKDENLLQNTPEENVPEKHISDEKIDEIFNLAAEQYILLADSLSEGQFPKTYHPKEKKIETSGSGWWTSGFYPGTLFFLYEETGEKNLITEAERILEDLKKEQYNKSTHDLGFMMYCSFGNAYKIDPKPEYEEILMNSAKSLATRYNDTAKVIRSWDSSPWNKAGDDDLVVIIDNMMNLELLFWATEHSKDSTYYNIAVNHADTTMKNHYRDDFSSYHEVIYDEKTGEVNAQITNQGFADESSWARGQSWGLYGYVVMYRETGDKYLVQAEHIADFILNNHNLPQDKIPYWDYDADNIPDALRDSSSAAINASALLELSGYAEGEKSSIYYKNAEVILESLTSPEYLAKKGELGGFLLKHAVGNMPNKTEINVPLSYGDYYFIEALKRYKNQ